MFGKYTGKFKKYEAEAVQEILDLHDGDEVAARTTVWRAVQGLSLPEQITNPELFKTAVDGLFFACGARWWYVGLIHRGLISEGDELPPLDVAAEGGA